MAAAALGVLSARSEANEALPQLPIQTIKNALDTFLESVAPLLSADELEQAAAEAKELEARQDLHDRLQQIREAAAKEGKSYLQDFWHQGYLQPRAGIAVNVNPFFVLEVSL